MKSVGFILGAIALAFAPMQEASANVIVNGDFALPVTGNFIVTTSIPGWTVTPGGAPATGVWRPTAYGFPAYNGINTAGFIGNGTTGFGGTGLFQQSFGYGISAGSTYRFGAAFFERPINSSSDYALGNYFIELLGGTTVVASLQGPSIASNNWKHLELVYLGQATDPALGNLSVRIRLQGDAQRPYQVSFTNATLDVPEPSTIALIAMALLSMFGFGMMRRRAHA